MICNLAFAKMDRTSYSVVGAGRRRLLKKYFCIDCMSKIKAVHSRFSYYITWGKEIGKCGGRKYEGGERARVEGEQVLRVQNEWLGIRNLE